MSKELVELKIKILEESIQIFKTEFNSKERPTDNIGICNILVRLIKENEFDLFTLGLEKHLGVIPLTEVFPNIYEVYEHHGGNKSSQTPFFWGPQEYGKRISTLETMLCREQMKLYKINNP